LHGSRSLLHLENQLGPALVESYAFMGRRCDRAVTAVMERIVAAAA
jgi:hypothetical protein